MNARLAPSDFADAIKALTRKVSVEAFDATNPTSRPAEAQEEFLRDFGKYRQQWIVAGNQSGKTATSIRNLTWFIEESHPYWRRPPEWANDNLLALVIGQTGKIIEESLLPRIEAFLSPNTYKVVRVGNVAQRIELDNGNTIVFQSMENEGQARKRVQSYVAHLICQDEMPQTTGFLNELFMRLNSKSGYFVASFTPLVVNPQIKKMVDTAKAPYAKKYLFRMFDNPVYRDSPEKQAEVFAQYASSSEAELRCRLYGEWMSADSAVWSVDLDSMVEDPEGYGPHWRHVEASDPAMKSAHGLVVAAQDPRTNVWYLVQADYIRGYLDPNALFDAVQQKLEGINLVRRISDTNSFYIGIAAGKGVQYMTPYDKNNRKAELIKGLQIALSSGRLKLTSWVKPAIEELTTAQYADSSTADHVKIKNGSDYHLADALQYLVDCLPKDVVSPLEKPWYQVVREQHDARKAAEYVAKQKKASSTSQRTPLRTTLRRRRLV